MPSREQAHDRELEPRARPTTPAADRLADIEARSEPISQRRVVSGSASWRDVLALQRRAGNRAVDQLIASSPAIVGESVQRPLPALQRAPVGTVGAVKEGYSLQDTEGGAGRAPGTWRKPGEGGYSRLMQGAAGEMVEAMGDEGALAGMMLRHVAPDLGGLPAAKQKWLNRATQAKKEIDSWTFNFAPGSTRAMYQHQYDSSNEQVAVIEKCAAELQQRSNQFNSFVPQGNGFFTSAARLSSMQALVGATDNASLAGALTLGLHDAEDVMKRYREKYEAGDRRLTTEKLDFPEGDQTVALAADDMTDASRDLDAAYMDFQTTLLKGEIGTIKGEYAQDEARLAEIEDVKQFVRHVGKTVDVTMTVVRGAPTAATNVTKSARHAKASVNAARNKRDILAGNRPRFNPTYVTTDANGNMVVRNMQTRLDSNLVTGEKLPSPADQGISLPKDVSDVLGKIADFAYSYEVERINLRLGQMRARINAVKAVIDATEFEAKILRYQNALNTFATKAAALEARIEDRRREYREFGLQLDRFAQVDRETRDAGQGVARGAERYALIMSLVAGVQEMLAVGTKSLDAAPADLPAWWQTVRDRRFSFPTEGETRTVNNMEGQLRGFRRQITVAKDQFGGVSDAARALMGAY